MLDLLLHRYHNIDYINKLPFRKGLKLLIKAYEQTERDKLYQHWLVLQPSEDEKFITPFDTWYNGLKEQVKLNASLKNESADDILAHYQKIQERISNKDANI